MKIRNVIICLLAVAVFAIPAVAQDECDSAQDQAVNPKIDTCTMTSNPADPTPSCNTGDPATQTGWFSFSATGTTARIRSDLSSTGSDSSYGVYSGTCGDLTEIGCSEDDASNPDNSAWLGDISICGLNVDETYYIRMGNWTTGACGSYTVDIEVPAPGITCGDGQISPCGDEECDGDDLGACDFGCNPDCSCSGRPSVPMLPNWGLAGLGLLLLAGGAMVFGRRRTATA